MRRIHAGADVDLPLVRAKARDEKARRGFESHEQCRRVAKLPKHLENRILITKIKTSKNRR